ncbi:MAG: zf-TFIIB domain-containing protein [Sphingomonadaceae bacterium]|nr:zf-TFIIB domain-containing protein [Sphingomonadaceae bacterium]
MNAAVGMPCPVCKVTLVMSDRQGIEIDYCPQCRGVWLDRGELDKIIERSAAADMQPQPAPAPQAAPPPQGGFAPQGYPMQHQGYGHDYPDKKRKKPFLEELFD